MATIEEVPVFETVTREELLEELDKDSRESMGLSAEEFLGKLRAGELDSYSPTVSRLAVLARLIRY